MRRLLLIIGCIAVTMARPGSYKEKEDFQYSRSSTDEGTKSGFYAAQRGNLNGNYEKAHNMDGLAQSQMSGLVRQVNGELGEDLVNSPTGKVSGSASTNGIYGQSHTDLSNLSGRNFQEDLSSAGSSSRSSQSRYKSYLDSASSRKSSGQSSFIASDAQRNEQGNLYRSSDLIDEDRGRNVNSLQSDYRGFSAGEEYNTRRHHDYDRISNQDSLYDNRNRKIVHNTPIKIQIRPGRISQVPITAQAVEDNNRAFEYDADTGSDTRNSIKGKEYKSSYSYSKQWEKHNTNPEAVALAIPTTNQLTHERNRNDYYGQQNQRNQNSHLSIDDSESYRSDMHSNVKSAIDEQQSLDYFQNAQAQREFARNQQSSLNTDNFETVPVNKPKRYESSYSYQKSWERRGDPYVIVPGSDSSRTSHDRQSSQRLTSASSHQYGRNQQLSHSSGTADCD